MLLAIIEIVNRGGAILPVLFILSIAAWYILLLRFYRIRIIERRICELETSGESVKQNGYRETGSILYESLTSNLKEHILGKDINIAATIYSIAPLLGLLGTVTGMIRTFTIIKIFGNGNPALMAEGISEALITTQAGLITAFPLMIFYSYLIRRIGRLHRNMPVSAVIQKGEGYAVSL